MRALLKNADVECATGVDGALNAEANEEEIQKAADLAARADAVILTLGEPEGDSGEGNSKQNLELPEAQYALLNAVLRANQNTAVLLFSGRPLAISRLAEKPARFSDVATGNGGRKRGCGTFVRQSDARRKIAHVFPVCHGAVPDLL